MQCGKNYRDVAKSREKSEKPKTTTPENVQIEKAGTRDDSSEKVIVTRKGK